MGLGKDEGVVKIVATLIREDTRQSAPLRADWDNKQGGVISISTNGKVSVAGATDDRSTQTANPDSHLVRGRSLYTPFLSAVVRGLIIQSRPRHSSVTRNLDLNAAANTGGTPPDGLRSAGGPTSPPLGTVTIRRKWGEVWQSHIVVTQFATPTS